MKNKKKDFWIIIIIIVMCLLIVAIIAIYNDNVKKLNCLKPYAESFCFEQNSTYVEHNIRYFGCNNTKYNPRITGSGEVNYFYFLPDELSKGCGLDF
jgi:flagellar basal body-associated protein FliL